jgi:type IV pilus assembly protein PilC
MTPPPSLTTHWPWRWQTQWQAQSPNAQHIKGHAPGRQPKALIMAQLRQQGLTPVRIRYRLLRTQQPVRAKDITSLTRQLSTLIKTGVPLMQALNLLTRTQAPGPVQQLLSRLQQAISEGSSLADALRSSGQFGSLYISMVQAGETAGILDDCLERLADTLERNAVLAGKVRSALAYPAIVMVIAMLVLVLIMVAVVPVFEEVFLGSGQPLPLPTQLILTLSRGLQAWSPALLVLPLLVYALHLSGKTKGLQQTLEKLQLRIPGVRNLVSTAVMARWSQTLASLLAAGVPLAEALPPAGQACDHSVYQGLSAKWSQQVAQGTRLSEALAQHGHVPALMIQMVHTGEETGAMALLLSRIGQLMDTQLQEQIRTLSTLMEPLIIVVLGMVIGGILVALYLPIFRMGQLF